LAIFQKENHCFQKRYSNIITFSTDINIKMWCAKLVSY